MVEFSIEIDYKLYPRIMKFKDEIYDITSILDKSLIIKKYIILLNYDKLKAVKIFGRHPNSNDKTNEFCLPSGIVNAIYNNNIKNIIEYVITTYNLDNCYFMPWGMIEYTKR